MKKVEQYIKEHTNRYSNHVELAPYITGFTKWLTIDDARKAVEIAREEIYEWLQKVSFDDYKVADEESYRMGCPYDDIDEQGLINDLKKAMKDE